MYIFTITGIYLFDIGNQIPQVPWYRSIKVGTLEEYFPNICVIQSSHLQWEDTK